MTQPSCTTCRHFHALHQTCRELEDRPMNPSRKCDLSRPLQTRPHHSPLPAPHWIKRRRTWKSKAGGARHRIRE